MPLESIEIRNFRVFKHAKFDGLRPVNVLVGANGSGKSTFFDALKFVKDAVQNGAHAAIEARGGFGEVCSRGGDQARLLFVLVFKLQIESADRLVRYTIEIESPTGERTDVPRESIEYVDPTLAQPYFALDFRYGIGSGKSHDALMSLLGQVSQFDPPDQRTLSGAGTLALKGVGQFAEYRAASAISAAIQGWHFSDIDVSSMRPTREFGPASHLSESGDNLSLVLTYLHQHHRAAFDDIARLLVQRIPWVDGIEPHVTEYERVMLRFHDRRFTMPFLSHHVSDGTLKLLAYLTLLNDPEPFPLVAVEEPENQIYPDLLRELSEDFGAYAYRGGQGFVSTHSHNFLNGMRPDQVWCLQKRSGFTVPVRADSNATLMAMFEEGDLLGYLWQNGLLTDLTRATA